MIGGGERALGGGEGHEYKEFKDSQKAGEVVLRIARLMEKIDSPDKAYFLGLLAADGCVYRRKNGSKSQAMIKLTLQEKDKDIL